MRALIIVDAQEDFVEGASAVRKGREAIPIINRIQSSYDLIVATQDWHPRNHISFAANHPGKKPLEQVEVCGLPQLLWPVHCIEDSPGAEFASGLDRARWDRIFQKGMDPQSDSLSGFFYTDYLRTTGMGEYLRERGVEEVTIAGFATDYCVKFTALDARRIGFRTRLATEACRGLNAKPGDVARALVEMRVAGVDIGGTVAAKAVHRLWSQATGVWLAITRGFNRLTCSR